MTVEGKLFDFFTPAKLASLEYTNASESNPFLIHSATMADIIGLERTISRASGFDAQVEMRKVRTLTQVNESRPGSNSSDGTVTPRPQGGDLEKSMEDRRLDAWENRPGKKDPNVVYWDGPDDPENPMNWPQWKKNVAIGEEYHFHQFQYLSNSLQESLPQSPLSPPSPPPCFRPVSPPS